jgi:putative nucleotidyltransferase with HDIG domain
MIPSRAETFRIMESSGMPDHIFRHSLMVTRVALVIGSWLKSSGLKIDLGLVDRASLLHDICKMECIGTMKDHALMGKEQLSLMGYLSVAEVVGQHVRLGSLNVDEAMVVNYADKRVMHDRVVSLTKRFVDLMARYGTDDVRRERILMHHEKCTQMQELLALNCSHDLEGLEELNLIPFDKTLNGR